MPETPSSQSLNEALRGILRFLAPWRIPTMVMGGLALSVWGRVRVTQDIDVAIALRSQEEEELLKALRRHHFLPMAPQPMQGHRLLVCRYLKTRKGLPVQVDLFLARGEYQEQALQRAVTVRLGNLPLRVISPEDLILYKLLADRPIDRLDVRTVIEEQGGRLDKKYLARWGRSLGLAKRLDPFMRQSSS